VDSDGAVVGWVDVSDEDEDSVEGSGDVVGSDEGEGPGDDGSVDDESSDEVAANCEQSPGCSARMFVATVCASQPPFRAPGANHAASAPNISVAATMIPSPARKASSGLRLAVAI